MSGATSSRGGPTALVQAIVENLGLYQAIAREVGVITALVRVREALDAVDLDAPDFDPGRVQEHFDNLATEARRLMDLGDGIRAEIAAMISGTIPADPPTESRH